MISVTKIACCSLVIILPSFSIAEPLIVLLPGTKPFFHFSFTARCGHEEKFRPMVYKQNFGVQLRTSVPNGKGDIFLNPAFLLNGKQMYNWPCSGHLRL